jgi:hypothetical protein
MLALPTVAYISEIMRVCGPNLGVWGGGGALDHQFIVTATPVMLLSNVRGPTAGMGLREIQN